MVIYLLLNLSIKKDIKPNSNSKKAERMPNIHIQKKHCKNIYNNWNQATEDITTHTVNSNLIHKKS